MGGFVGGGGEPAPTEACPHCGREFRSLARHLPHCPESPRAREKKGAHPPKKGDGGKEKARLMKMFRAACNGKNYWKKWFPGYDDYGDFQADFFRRVMEL